MNIFKKIMGKEPLTPRFTVGDTVFILENGKIVEKQITGVFSVFKKDESTNPKICEFKYYIGTNVPDSRWHWIDEKDLFSTREELIASL